MEHKIDIDGNVFWTNGTFSYAIHVGRMAAIDKDCRLWIIYPEVGSPTLSDSQYGGRLKIDGTHSISQIMAIFAPPHSFNRHKIENIEYITTQLKKLGVKP